MAMPASDMWLAADGMRTGQRLNSIPYKACAGQPGQNDAPSRNSHNHSPTEAPLHSPRLLYPSHPNALHLHLEHRLLVLLPRAPLNIPLSASSTPHGQPRSKHPQQPRSPSQGRTPTVARARAFAVRPATSHSARASGRASSRPIRTAVV